MTRRVAEHVDVGQGRIAIGIGNVLDEARVARRRLDRVVVGGGGGRRRWVDDHVGDHVGGAGRGQIVDVEEVRRGHVKGHAVGVDRVAGLVELDNLARRILAQVERVGGAPPHHEVYEEADDGDEEEGHAADDHERQVDARLDELELAVLLVAVVARVAVEHAVAHEALADAVAVGLLAYEAVRVDAVLAAGALELVAVVVELHGRPAQLEAVGAVATLARHRICCCCRCCCCCGHVDCFAIAARCRCCHGGCSRQRSVARVDRTLATLRRW